MDSATDNNIVTSPSNTATSEPSEEPHVNPPLDCRPKVIPETSKSPLAVSDPETLKSKAEAVTLSFECDENFECGVLEEDDEAAITQWRTGCQKNPGHEKFIPIQEFSLDHKLIPKAYRKPVFVKGIKSVADLTVRLRVLYTSKARPDHDHFAKFRGTRVVRTGSGFVCTGISRRKIKGLEFPELFISHPEVDVGRRADTASNNDILDEMGTFVGNRLKEFVNSIPKNAETVWKILMSSHDLMNVIKTALKSGLGISHEYFCQSLVSSIFRGVLPSSQGLSNDAGTVNKIDKMENMRLDRPASVDYEEEGFETLFTLFDGVELVEKLNPLTGFEEKLDMVGKLVADNLRANVHPMFIKNLELEQMRKYLDEMLTTIHVILGDADPPRFTNQGDSDTDYIEERKKKENKDNDEEILSLTCRVKNHQQCLCKDCYLITVMTARHVVFNTAEALKTEVDFFYDDDTKEGMVSLHVVDVEAYSAAGDFVTLLCSTHDRELAMKIDKMLVEMSENIKEMKSKSDTPLAVICSHPHGNFKHVTVGEWTTRYKHQKYYYYLRSLYTSYLYDTPTCSGSSGAPVLILGYKDGTLSLDSPLHPHHGSKDEQGLNQSTRFFSEKADMKTLSDEAKQRVEKDLQEYETLMRDEGKTLKEKLMISLSEIKTHLMQVQARPHPWKEDFINRLSTMVNNVYVDGVHNLCNELLQLRQDVNASRNDPDINVEPTSRPSIKRQDSIPLD